MKQTFIEREARRHVNSLFYTISVFPFLFSLENRQPHLRVIFTIF